MRKLLIALTLLIAVPAAAETPAQIDARVRRIFSRAFNGGELQYLMLHLNGTLMANGGSIDNETNNALTFSENSEDLTLTFGTNLATFASTTGATITFTPATTHTGIATFSDALTLSDGATFDQSANNVLTFAENSEDWELTFASNSVTMASTTGAVLTITPATTITGALTQTGDATLNGGAGALAFGAASSSVTTTDNSATGLDIGATGLTNMIRIVTTDDAEYVQFQGVAGASTAIVGANVTLDASDCGKWHTISAAFDTFLITLPALSAVPTGCELKFHYIGANGGALVDITPNAADGIEGGCTLAASVVTFSGTDDADVGLTKASILKGDTITITDVGDADDWYASRIQGICANN